MTIMVNMHIPVHTHEQHACTVVHFFIQSTMYIVQYCTVEGKLGLLGL